MTDTQTPELSGIWCPPELNPDFPNGCWREPTLIGPIDVDLGPIPPGPARDALVAALAALEDREVPGEKLLVWVNACPASSRYGGGWFEAYNGDPANYEPRRDATSDDDGYLEPADVRDDLAIAARANAENRARIRTELLEQLDTLDADDPVRERVEELLINDFPEEATA